MHTNPNFTRIINELVNHHLLLVTIRPRVAGWPFLHRGVTLKQDRMMAYLTTTIQPPNPQPPSRHWESPPVPGHWAKPWRNLVRPGRWWQGASRGAGRPWGLGDGWLGSWINCEWFSRLISLYSLNTIGIIYQLWLYTNQAKAPSLEANKSPYSLGLTHFSFSSHETPWV